MLKFAFPKPAMLAGPVLASLVAVAAPMPALAQDGLVMRNIFGKIGLLPEEKDPIEYRERPALVVPKDLGKLRQPEKPEQHTRNGQWPLDPDAVERERERKRRNANVFFPTRADSSEGGRLSPAELAAGRIRRGHTVGEAPTSGNDKGSIRMSVQEMEAAGKVASAPSYPPGTEPPRVYLTDPPKGLRMPSANAPAGKRTTDGPIVDTFRSLGAWSKNPE